MREAAERLLGSHVKTSARLHGGDLSDVSVLTLADGRRVVAKTGPMVDREARMLRAIAAAGAPAPRVLGVEGGLLLLQFLNETPRSAAASAALGHALATLHATRGKRYGWPDDYAFGHVEIRNTPSDDWPGFWAEQRLLAAPGALPAELAHRLDRLAARLPEMLPKSPAPSLLHGDLWTGNVLFSGAGAWLIDPASYHGDAEVDLAMLALFGGLDAETRDAYGPLAPGWQDRRAVYQLWPALVHLRLFGAGYRQMVETRLTVLGA